MLKDKKVLVTGGSGFLGRHLLPLLANTGADISCLARPGRKLAITNVKIISGDCLNQNDIKRAAANQDIVIHMAGKLFGGNWTEYFKHNGTMAENIAEASGTARVILISSLAASGPSAAPKKESDPASPVSAYGWSKLMAERILQAAIPNLAILRPPIIYGSGDKGLLPLFKSTGKGLGITPGAFPISAVHALDCARAIIALCVQEDATGIYHVGDGQIHTMKSLCLAMGDAQGRHKMAVINTPAALLKTSAMFSSVAWLARSQLSRIMGWKPPSPPSWNMDKLKESLQPGWVADTGKIVRELGFTPQISLEEGMREAVDGYRRDGWL